MKDMENEKRTYLCDIWSNNHCDKTGCIINGGPCLATTNEEYAYTEHGVPVEADEHILDWASKVGRM